MSIPAKLVLLVPGLVAVGLMIFGYCTLEQMEDSQASILAQVAEQRLIQIHRQKKQELRSFIERLQRRFATMASSPTVIGAAEQFRTAVQAVPRSDASAAMPGVESFYRYEFAERLSEEAKSEVKVDGVIPSDATALVLQSRYIVSNPHPLERRDDLVAAPDGSLYSEVHGEFHTFFQAELHDFGFSDLYIIDSVSSRVLYSVKKKIDFGVRLLSSHLSGTQLAKVASSARSSSPGAVAFADLAPYLPSLGRSSGFMATPIYRDGLEVGILVGQFGTESMQPLLSFHQRWGEIGLGTAGESVLVGPDGRLRSERRVWLERSDNLAKKLAQDGMTPVHLEQLARYQSTVGLPFQFSAAIEPGRETTTHFGETAVAVSPLELDGVPWYLATVMDKADGFSPTLPDALSKFMVRAALLLVMASVAAAWLLGHSIAKPIQQVSKALSELPSNPRIDSRTGLFEGREANELGRAVRRLQHALSSGFRDLAQAASAIEAGIFSSELLEVPQGEFGLPHRRMNQSLVVLQRVCAEIRKKVGGIGDLVADAKDVVAEMDSEARTQVDDSREALDALDTTTTATRVLEEKAKSVRGLTDLVLQDAASVHEGATGVARSIDKLQGSWNGLSQLSGQFEDLAFFLNILAVNASVEAAKAKHAGLGFATLAAQMQNTASKAAELAQAGNEIVQTTADAMQEGWSSGEALQATSAKLEQTASSMTALLTELAEDTIEQSSSFVESREVVLAVLEGAETSASHIQVLLELNEEFRREMRGLGAWLAPGGWEAEVELSSAEESPSWPGLDLQQTEHTEPGLGPVDEQPGAPLPSLLKREPNFADFEAVQD